MLFETTDKSKALKSLTAVVASIALVGCANANAGEKTNADKVKETQTAETETTKWKADDEVTTSEESLAELLDDAYPTPEVETDMIVGKVYFGFDSSQLDAEDKKSLDLIATWLEEHPTKGLVVAGHADIQGAYHYNMQLARERADAAKNYLVKKGIDAERLEAVSHGERHLEAMGATPAVHEMNRRVTFRTDPANAYGVNLDYKPDNSKFASKDAQ